VPKVAVDNKTCFVISPIGDERSRRAGANWYWTRDSVRPPAVVKAVKERKRKKG
jgi:hypothetical protein